MLSAFLILFISAFLAATLLPFYSEVVLFAQIQAGYPVAWLVLVATLGNTLGSVVNWWLGLFVLHFQHRRWFPFKEKEIARAQGWFQRYGKWSLLMAWAPIGGDALTFFAGVMRVHWLPFVVLVGLGKGLRYAFVAYVAVSGQQWLGL